MPKFQRRHYEAVAAEITMLAGHLAETDRRFVAMRLAAMFADDNARFDRGRFMVACGVKP